MLNFYNFLLKETSKGGNVLQYNRGQAKTLAMMNDSAWHNF